MSQPSKNRAIDKIRKLLRMSKSSNANEAATALRQAQKMMEQHAIDAAEVDDFEQEPIEEHAAPRRGKNPPVYVSALQLLIADAFGVDTYRRPGWLLEPTGRIYFVGPSSHAQIALYAFQVLLRQLEADRRRHLKRVRKAKNRAARGDEFGLAWVHGVKALVGTFAGTPDPRIAAYMARNHPDLKMATAKPRASKAVSWNDQAAGRDAGRNARLNRGVHGSAQRQIGVD